MDDNDLITATDDLARVAHSLRQAARHQAVNPNRLRRIAADLQAVATKIESTADILADLAHDLDAGGDATIQGAYLRDLADELY